MLLISYNTGRSFLNYPTEYRKNRIWKRILDGKIVNNARYADAVNGIGCNGKQRS